MRNDTKEAAQRESFARLQDAGRRIVDLETKEYPVADAAGVGAAIHGATAKTTPVDADTMPLIDSAASNVLKKVTWANIKATLKTYFDTLYATATGWIKADGSIPLTAEWDIGENMAIRAERLEARDAEGLRIEDDAGNLGAFVQDATGYIGILNATPGYALDIKVNAIRSQMHFSGTNADSGGYMVSASANNFFMMGGAHFDTPNWVAKSTSAGIFGTQLGTFEWFADTGLTIGNNYTPTSLMFLSAPGLAVGTSGAAARGKADIKQGSTTAAIPVIVLEQTDIDQDMIEFVTTIGTGNAIEAVGAKVLTTTHFIKVTLPGGLTRYIPCGTIA